MTDSARRLVLCVGNPHRGDDGVGRLVARLLYGRLPQDVLIAECDGGAAAVLDLTAGRECAILIDAAVSGAPAGTVHRVDCVAGAVVPTAGVASSHGLGVAEAIALARTLGCLPRLCVIYAVEAKRLAPGDELSPEVTHAARQVAEHVLRSLRGSASRTLCPPRREGDHPSTPVMRVNREAQAELHEGKVRRAGGQRSHAATISGTASAVCAGASIASAVAARSSSASASDAQACHYLTGLVRAGLEAPVSSKHSTGEGGGNRHHAMSATTILSATGRYRLCIPESPEHWELYHRIRRDVLLEAQKHAIELQDELAPGHHPRLLWLDEQPIGSIRVDVLAPGRAALRLVAIHSEWQRKGHGSALLNLAEELARDLGCHETVVYATPEAAGFYGKASYAEEDWDDTYVSGIVQMVKKLD